mmetsp:Transcript_14673/g.55270  ORF Transcript_14673/g.55270 Transcript_14673/m.55270 type:complete len:204 (+) Transcript_14673:97-708(+)
MGLGLGANTATRKIKQRANHAGSNKRHTRVERRRSSSRRTQCGRERRAEDSAGLGSERIQLTRSCAQLLREGVESGPPELRCSSLGCCDVGRRGAVAAWPAHGETRASRKKWRLRRRSFRQVHGGRRHGRSAGALARRAEGRGAVVVERRVHELLDEGHGGGCGRSGDGVRVVLLDEGPSGRGRDHRAGRRVDGRHCRGTGGR